MTIRHDPHDGDRPVDLSALRPNDARERRDALAARIVAAAGPELARRRVRAAARFGGASLVDGVVALVARFSAPALIAAAAALLVAVAASRVATSEASSGDLIASSETLSDETVRQALRAGVDPGAAWITQQRVPSAEEIVGGADEGDQE
jgi:hypothetical protein